MQKIRDISAGQDRVDIDILSSSHLRESRVLKSSDAEIYTDIVNGHTGTRQDIKLSEISEIQVPSRKKQKNFDALEKKSFFKKMFTRDIVIKGEKLQINKTQPKEVIQSKNSSDITSNQIINSEVKINTEKRIFSKKKLQNFYFSNVFKREESEYSHKFFLTAGILSLSLCIILTGFFRILVENRVYAGYEKLSQIREGSLGVEDIKRNINNARFDLMLADVFFTPFKIFPNTDIDTAKQIITGGRYLSQGLDTLMGIYDDFERYTQNKDLSKIFFTEFFKNISPNLLQIENSLEQALTEYESINTSDNPELEATRQGNIVKIQNILSKLQVLNNNYDAFLNLLGQKQRKRYLIVFQNADEIRPTGGFMGSMGLLEIFKGRVQLFQKKDVYAIEWDLKTADYERLDAPKGIAELTEKFGLRDANYYANLQDSSNAIKFFTDQAGIDLDGIIYINQNTLLELLKITGPVYFPELDMDITADNFSETMSLVVEAKIFKGGTLGTPKQILFDFMQIFIQKLIDEGKYFDYLQALVHDTESRDIMAWSFDAGENNFLTELGVNGKIDYTQTLDHTYPVYTSLSGNKSDRFIERSYSQIVTRGELCEYIINFEIISEHTFNQADRSSILNLKNIYNLDNPDLLQIQGNARNRQYVRVILPDSADIPLRDDYEIVDYGARKGIEFFLDIQVSETSSFDFNYTLPNPECVEYDYMFYKQPGIPEYDIDLNLFGEPFQYTDLKQDFYFKLRD